MSSIEIRSNLPITNEWRGKLERSLFIIDSRFSLIFCSELPVYQNLNNVFFACNEPNGRLIVSACNALFRSLVNFDIVLTSHEAVAVVVRNKKQ